VAEIFDAQAADLVADSLGVSLSAFRQYVRDFTTICADFVSCFQDRIKQLRPEAPFPEGFQDVVLAFALFMRPQLHLIESCCNENQFLCVPPLCRSIIEFVFRLFVANSTNPRPCLEVFINSVQVDSVPSSTSAKTAIRNIAPGKEDSLDLAWRIACGEVHGAHSDAQKLAETMSRRGFFPKDLSKVVMLSHSGLYQVLLLASEFEHMNSLFIPGNAPTTERDKDGNWNIQDIGISKKLALSEIQPIIRQFLIWKCCAIPWLVIDEIITLFEEIEKTGGSEETPVRELFGLRNKAEVARLISKVGPSMETIYKNMPFSDKLIYF